MKVSGFTILKNGSKFHYPFLESIKSILPICDEFIVNLGDSDDDTPVLLRSLKSPKIKIIHSQWDFTKGNIELSQQTNRALAECKGDWAFYLQSDEMIHEKDLPKVYGLMKSYVQDRAVDALRFSWLHFYGSYHRYRIDQGWYQKQDRIIRNNGTIESFGDAFGFQRKDLSPLRRRHTGCFLYHYGWVHQQEVMTLRRVNAEHMGITTLEAHERQSAYSYGDLNRFPVYYGSHPQVMRERILGHEVSRQDWGQIQKHLWWHPFLYFRPRYKTHRRVRERLS